MSPFRAVRAVWDGLHSRRRPSLTPAGNGVLCLLVPGLLLAVLSQHQLLVAVGIGAGLLIVVNGVVAATALRHLSVTASGPELVEVGDRAAVSLTIAGDEGAACEVRLDGTPEWRPVTVPATGQLSIEFVERTVIDALTFSVRTSYPLDLVTLSRVITVKLQSPIVVAPAPITTPVDSLPSNLGKPIFGADELGGLRPYQPGDSRRDIHWPSVARTGTLMIRERQASPGPGVADVYVVANRPAGVEQAIGRARSAGEHLLAAGYRIRLDPPPRSPVGADATTPIRSPRELARRLATIELSNERDASPPNRTGSVLEVDEKGARWQAFD